MSKLEETLFNQIRVLSIDAGRFWHNFDEPEREYKLFKDQPCFICKSIERAAERDQLQSGRFGCTICNGKGVLPNYRMDFYWPKNRLAVEVQGGIHLKGKSGHSSGKGIQRDIRKLQLCALENVKLVQVSSADIESGIAFKIIIKLLSQKE
tara:strand:+ start:221 stop:673 length:453 start_codon:yes stop_codon:yes gene_type:complete